MAGVSDRDRCVVGLVAAVLVAMAGCNTLLTSPAATSTSLLNAARSSPDAVTLDIYWATLPPESELSENALWRFVQEDRLDADLRRRLSENGLRAGVVGGVPPDEVVRLLDPLGKHAGETSSSEAGESDGALSAPTGVARKTTQLRPGQPLEIRASETLDDAPLVAAGGRSAEVLKRAQAFYALRVAERGDGGYAVQLTPELQSGEPRWRWSQDESGAISRQKPLRDKRVFSDLKIEAPLVVGEMLIVTSRADASPSLLGGCLHRAEEGVEGERKAIVVRLTQTPIDDVFAPESAGVAADHGG